MPRTLPLWPLVAMTSLPFLMPHHRLPIPTFFQEWWAAILGLAATVAFFATRDRAPLSVPRTALLPLALAALVLVQGALLPEVRGDTTLVAALYLLWAALLMTLARSLCATLGAGALAAALATGIALGALASALVVALQAGGTLHGKGWISDPIGQRLFGNLNQPNHLALQLWLGIAAVLHLHATRRISAVAGTLAVVALAGAALLAGSRAVLAYALVLPLVAAWQPGRRDPARPMLRLALIALAATLLGQALLAQFGEPANATTLAQREWGKDSHAVRTGLWWMALQMGFAHPIAGIGWERFATETFARLAEYRAAAPATLVLVPAEHAHNLFLQLFAELGATAPLLVLGFGFAWLAGLFRRPSAEAPFALALIVLIMLHGQVEYTLWYAFFLGIAALVLGLGETRDFRLPAPRPALVGLVLAAALATAGVLRADYARLETAMRWPLADDGKPPKAWSEVTDELLTLRRQSRFSSYVDLALAGAMRLDREQLRDKLVLCEAAIAFSPTDYAVFKCAGLLALAGRREAALDRLERALLAYPERAAQFIETGGALAAAQPELAPLVAAARTFARERKLVSG